MLGNFLGSLVQSCCREGGTLQTNITGVCGECSQCCRDTGFFPTHGMCTFPVYTAQALGCSARNCLRQALGYMHFPGLSHSGPGTWVHLTGAEAFGPSFCALPWSEPLRWPAVWWAQSLLLITFPVPVAQFSECTTGSPSQADVDHPESQEVLVSNEACLQFGRWCLSGAAIAPLQLGLPSPAGRFSTDWTTREFHL